MGYTINESNHCWALPCPPISTDTGVTANSLHPGSVNTDLQRHVKSGVLGRLFFGTLGKLFMIDAVQGAQTTLRLALDPALEQVSGKYFA